MSNTATRIFLRPCLHSIMSCPAPVEAQPFGKTLQLHAKNATLRKGIRLPMKRECLPNVHPKPHQFLHIYTSIAIFAATILPGRSTCTSTEMARFPILKSFIVLFSVSLLFLSCGPRAPKDYYFEFTLMEEWGEHNRRRTGRNPRQTVSHPEKSEPLGSCIRDGKSAVTTNRFQAVQCPRSSTYRPILQTYAAQNTRFMATRRTPSNFSRAKYPGNPLEI